MRGVLGVARDQVAEPIRVGHLSVRGEGVGRHRSLIRPRCGVVLDQRQRRDRPWLRGQLPVASLDHRRKPALLTLQRLDLLRGQQKVPAASLRHTRRR